MPHIEIVTPFDDWILDRMGQSLVDNLTGPWAAARVSKPSGTADITYFMHYALYEQVPGKTMAWFTHLEPGGHPLHDRWLAVARLVNRCVTGADMWLEHLPAGSVMILPVIDLEGFTPRKMRVGMAAQRAHDNDWRKGRDLLERIKVECADWIEVVETDGKLTREEMPDWYRSLDVYLCTSRIEGTGPTCAVEALCCGVPVIMPRVGNWREIYYHPLVSLYEGEFDMPRKLTQESMRKYPAQAVALLIKFSAQRFAENHIRVFEEVLK
jgi:hypothetical protein